MHVCMCDTAHTTTNTTRHTHTSHSDTAAVYTTVANHLRAGMGHSIGCRMRSCPGAVHPHQAPCLKPSAALPSHQLARNLVAQPSHDARRRPTPPVRATSQPGTTPAAELRVILDTADAQASIKFVDVPNRKGQDIVLCEVRPDSPAAANGLCVGQKLLAISDPVRQNEMWIINDRASFRFVRCAQ